MHMMSMKLMYNVNIIHIFNTLRLMSLKRNKVSHTICTSFYLDSDM